MEIAAAVGKLESNTTLYNETATNTRLLPLESAKYAHGVNYHLQLDLSGTVAESMLSCDLKRVVKPALVKLKESFCKTLRKQAVEKRRAQEALSMSIDMRSEKQDELTALQARLAKLETAYREQRELKNGELKERVARIEDLELELQCSL